MGRDRKIVRRQPERGRYDRPSIDAVLDAGLVAHVAFVDLGQPYCIPMMYGRVDDSVCVHGSTASRAIKMLATGTPACLTVTLVDGLVLARSAFEHSANYRSAVLVGSFRVVAEEELKRRAFEAFANKLVPGRWTEVRPPNTKELKSSMILEMPIDEAAVKIRTGPPSDDDSPDAELPTWAGVVPMVTSFGAPEPSPGLAAGIPLADSVRRLRSRNVK
ncbi:MAG TPA: pyridoxamine 5'-phosphate oxidase family protein [Actinomycetota bacterium]|nr:pyridoxamine 5'-phosphate oxidase family protein [Actinomycetota bacterium]